MTTFMPLLEVKNRIPLASALFGYYSFVNLATKKDCLVKDVFTENSTRILLIWHGVIKDPINLQRLEKTAASG